MGPVMLHIVYSGNNISNQLMSKMHLDENLLSIRRREIGHESRDAFLGIGLDLAISIKTKDDRRERTVKNPAFQDVSETTFSRNLTLTALRLDRVR